MGRIDKNEHEKYLAEKPVEFICKETSTSRKYTCPGSGNVYRFFDGQVRLVKDARDIAHFRSASYLFTEVGKEIKKSKSDEAPTAEELVEEKPKSSTRKTASKKSSKTKSLNTKKA